MTQNYAERLMTAREFDQTDIMVYKQYERVRKTASISVRAAPSFKQHPSTFTQISPNKRQSVWVIEDQTTRLTPLKFFKENQAFKFGARKATQ